MKRLIDRCEQSSTKRNLSRKKPDPLGTLLYQCIRDEVQISAHTLRRAFLELALRRTSLHLESNWIDRICSGKFADIFRETIEQTILAGGDHFEQYFGSSKELTFVQFAVEHGRTMSDSVAGVLREGLSSPNRLDQIRAAVVAMQLAFYFSVQPKQKNEAVRGRFLSLYEGLSAMIDTNDLPRSLTASWAFAWIGDQRLLPVPAKPELLLSLYELWRGIQANGQRLYPAWALSTQNLLERNTFSRDAWGDCDSFLREMVSSGQQEFEDAALVVAWYRGAPWTDIELTHQLANRMGSRISGGQALELLKNLGDSGRRVIERLMG